MEQSYKKIAITGANSFLGTNVVRELARQGIESRAIVRRSNPTIDSIESCAKIKGNVLDFNDLSIAARGCSCIIHIAAITDQSLLHYEDYRSFNVAAVENVIAVARAEGIKRVIFVSSANAIGNGTPDHPGEESTPINGAYARQLYGLSKMEAERVLRQATDIESVIVNPCFMLGAYDSKPSSGAIIMMGYGKRMVFATPGGKNFVDVEGAATAIVNAIEQARAGENYLLAGQDMSIADFMRLLARTTGRKSLVVVVPCFCLYIAGYFGDLLRAMGVRTQISSPNMGVICTKEYYSGAKAARELGLPPTDVEATIRKAVDWFTQNGMLK